MEPLTKRRFERVGFNPTARPFVPRTRRGGKKSKHMRKKSMTKKENIDV